MGAETVDTLLLAEGPRLTKQKVEWAQLLRLAMRGLPASKAARVVGCSEEKARQIYKDQGFRRLVLKRLGEAFEEADERFLLERKSLAEKLDEAAHQAFEELKALLEAGDTPKGLKVKIAQDFLDRSSEGQKSTRLLVDADILVRAARTARELDESTRASRERES